MPIAGIDVVRLSYLEWLDSEEKTMQRKYRMFREYYEGNHSTQLTARQRAFLEIKADQEFNSNFCPIVVDAIWERLKVSGFTCQDKASQDAFSDWWKRNRMDAVQAIVHMAAVRDGDTYLLVEWNDKKGRPKFTHQPAYDGYYGVHAFYDDEDSGTIAAAVKYWQTSHGPNAGLRRANLYYPDKVEKYVQRDGWWQRWLDEGQREWPIDWTDLQSNPLGVPVIHFKNKDIGKSYGVSELDDVCPMQNAKNKSLIDLMAAADTTAFRILTMTGGDPTGIAVSPGGWVYSTNPDAKFDAIDAADLTSLIATNNSMVMEIAEITRTPLGYFQVSGQVAAEGTLKEQGSGLLSKITDRSVTFGNGWEDAMDMGRKLHNLHGDGGLDEEELISCEWGEFETRNEKELLEGLKIKRDLGVPQDTIWSEMGYDSDAIARMKAELQEEQKGKSAGLARALLDAEKSFNAGGVSGGNAMLGQGRVDVTPEENQA
jgi:hypothetical protein